MAKHEGNGKSDDDGGRLDRLFEYTKFHIGIYLSIGAGVGAVLGSRDHIKVVGCIVSTPAALAWGLLFMAVAGLAGGTIASTTTQFKTFEQLWNHPQGLWRWKWKWLWGWPSGECWARIEHLSFWVGLVLMVFSVVSPLHLWTLMIGGTPPSIACLQSSTAEEKKPIN